MKAAVVSVVALLLSSIAFAGHHDAAYYKRTGTSPPVQGDWYLGFRGTGANHAFGVGLATAGQWKDVGKYHTDILWNGDLSRIHTAGQSGSVPFTVGCIDYAVPFVAPDKTTTQIGSSVLFRVGK